MKEAMKKVTKKSREDLCDCSRKDVGLHNVGFCEQVRNAEKHYKKVWCEECESFE